MFISLKVILPHFVKKHLCMIPKSFGLLFYLKKQHGDYST
jgi:hypothetical protein